MYKFEDKIYEVRRRIIKEEDLPPPPPTDDPAAAAAPPPEDPNAAPAVPPPPEDHIDDAPDDVQKMKLDMVESIRKALIINPNDVDRSLYAKLTNTTSLENLDDMEKTVQELVRNYYPDTEL